MKQIKLILVSIIFFLAAAALAQAQYTLLIWGATTSDVAVTSSRVSFNTNYTASGYIEYGTSTAYNLRTPPLVNYSQFRFVLDNLTSSTTYHYRIVVTDDTGTTITSSNFSFTTIAPLPSPIVTTTTTATTTSYPSIPTAATTSIPELCEYAAPLPGCNYVAGPNYDPKTSCGLILQCPNALTKPLYFGLRDPQVKILQQVLIDHGYLAAGLDTGYFGYLTRRAVQRFQCAFNIVCSGSAYGYVGPKTRAAINSLTNF